MVQIVGLGLLVTLISVILKEQKREFAFLLVIIAGIYIFLFLLDQISLVIRLIEDLASRAQVDNVFLETVLKIIGIAYIAEFGGQIARDAGEASMASKIELAGKVLILVMAIPIITIIVETILQLLPI